MTGTYTLSETFTRTNAKYLASKVVSDLYQMQIFYGKPTDVEINNYLEELVILLLDDCLDSVDYGYRKDGKWVIVVKYVAQYGNISQVDDQSGGVYPGADISGADWGSYLRTNSVYDNLPQAEKERIQQLLPIQRNSQAEPGYQNGIWVSNKNYFSGGTGLERNLFRPI